MRGLRNSAANFSVFATIFVFIGGIASGEPLNGMIAAAIWFLIFMVVRPKE
jgi:hypothetical protein